MDLIIDGLFVWLVLAVVAMGVAIVTQVRRMKRFMGAGSFGEASDEMTKGMAVTALSAVVGSISLILFIVAAIGALVK